MLSINSICYALTFEGTEIVIATEIVTMTENVTPTENVTEIVTGTVIEIGTEIATEIAISTETEAEIEEGVEVMTMMTAMAVSLLVNGFLEEQQLRHLPLLCRNHQVCAVLKSA